MSERVNCDLSASSVDNEDPPNLKLRFSWPWDGFGDAEDFWSRPCDKLCDDAALASFLDSMISGLGRRGGTGLESTALGIPVSFERWRLDVRWGMGGIGGASSGPKWSNPSRSYFAGVRKAFSSCSTKLRRLPADSLKLLSSLVKSNDFLVSFSSSDDESLSS
jgi:hypothetical protein